MKKIKNLLVGLSAMIVLATSCSDFGDMNIDPVRLDKVNPGNFLNPILYELSCYNWRRYNDFTFTLMQLKVSTNSSNGVGWFFISDAAGDGSWTTYYRWLNNISIMEQSAAELNEPNYQAIGMTLRSYIFHILTDAFGNVPMTEACKGSEKVFTPAFDDQKAIYRQILNDLKDANELFNTAASGAGAGLRYNQEGEFLYGAGTASAASALAIGKWKKFCNSLRLRVLMRVIDVAEFNAAQEIRTMLSDAVQYPVFENNADAAFLPISGMAPMEAPMPRYQDFSSYLVYSEFFVNTYKLWNDPRLPYFANRATNNGVSDYYGLPSGYAVQPAFSASSLNSGVARCQGPVKVCLMNYAEIEFIKAELAQRGLLTDNAEEAYKKGITAAIQQWDLAVPADYFDNENTAYNGSLERILLQKFFALYFCDYQQWYEHNRTGLPVIPRGDGVPSANQMPKRFKYPAALQRTNLKNYQDARTAMGGDDFTVKLFWQK
jgi:hypothetical protein